MSLLLTALAEFSDQPKELAQVPLTGEALASITSGSGDDNMSEASSSAFDSLTPSEDEEFSSGSG